MEIASVYVSKNVEPTIICSFLYSSNLWQSPQLQLNTTSTPDRTQLASLETCPPFNPNMLQSEDLAWTSAIFSPRFFLFFFLIFPDEESFENSKAWLIFHFQLFLGMDGHDSAGSSPSTGLRCWLGPTEMQLCCKFVMAPWLLYYGYCLTCLDVTPKDWGWKHIRLFILRPM